MDETGTVVVGVDGSIGSRAALEHALADAARRRSRLRVVAAVPLPDYRVTAYGMGGYGMGVPPPSAEIIADMRAEAQRMVDDVVAAQSVAVRVPIGVAAIVGAPAEVLLEASQGADLLVLGHRGRGAFASALLGSVGLQCVLHAACPVTIVRPTAAPGEPEAATSGALAPA